MRYRETIILFIILVAGPRLAWSDNARRANNPLAGRHLQVLAVDFFPSLTTVRNSTGHVIQVKGPMTQMMNSISERFHFSYSYIPYSAWAFDDSPKGKGIYSYILNKTADYALSNTIPTAARSRVVNFPASHVSGRFSTMVPYPELKMNIIASVKPLSYQVWIAVGVSMVAALACLICVQRQLGRREQSSKSSKKKSNSSTDCHHYRRKYVEYIWGNLVSQGNFLPSKRLSIRIVAGAWCCACFFLVQIYCSTLTSHLTSPNQKPIISSFFDIANTPGVSLAVEMGQGIDVLLKNDQSENMKQLVSMMNKNPSLRCNVTETCLAKVKQGTDTVFASNTETLKAFIRKEVMITGTCTVALLKETFWSTPIFTVLPKHSPYTEQFSIGILWLRDTGIGDYWENLYFLSSKRCMEFDRKQKTSTRLSIAHLSSAFLILGVGYCAALIIFALENIALLVKSKKN